MLYLCIALLLTALEKSLWAMRPSIGDSRLCKNIKANALWKTASSKGETKGRKCIGASIIKRSTYIWCCWAAVFAEQQLLCIVCFSSLQTHQPGQHSRSRYVHTYSFHSFLERSKAWADSLSLCISIPRFLFISYRGKAVIEGAEGLKEERGVTPREEREVQPPSHAEFDLWATQASRAAKPG